MRYLLLLLFLWAPAYGHPPIELIDYPITKGDTCASIAKKLYGDSSRYDIIHAFNPQLGPKLPHRHTVGDTLRLPPRIPPNAWVTAITRRVEHRSARASDWQPSRSGTPLQVGYRVSTHDESAAELTFEDDSAVELQENTLLVIFGRSARDARAEPNRARLEHGTLRARLAELRGEAPGATPPAGLRLESPAASAMSTNASILMSVEPDGMAAVSNHGGGDIEVASMSFPSAKVSVIDGMGTRVKRGQRPEPPRPLPAAPAWTGATELVGWGATGPQAAVTLRWAPVPDAARWRIELRKGGSTFAAMPLPTHQLDARLLGLPEGTYTVTLSTRDIHGLTSKPSAPATVHIKALAGGETLAPGTRVGGCLLPNATPGPATLLPEAAGDVQLTCGDRTLTVQVGGTH